MSDEPQRPPQGDGEPNLLEGRVHRVPSRGQVNRIGGTGREGTNRADRDRSVVPESKLIAGRFGRMFRNLPSFEPGEPTIEQCMKQLLERANASDERHDNPRIPAGFTYLGQFIDHDLTFDPVSQLDRQNDPDGLQNFRTPRFDLDSVYGLGPADQPYLYQKRNSEHPDGDPAKFVIGTATLPPDPSLEPEDDLPRNEFGTALIGDPRNDENIIVSQLQLAFLKLHNQLVQDIRDSIKGDVKEGRPNLASYLWSTEDSTSNVFHEAQRLARWHYQWIVLTEFLPKICGEDTVQKLVDEIPVDAEGNALPTDVPPEKVVAVRRRVKDLEYYKPRELPYIPVEWSVAAYRYGHSQIRPTYNLSRALMETRKHFGVQEDIPIFIKDPDENPLGHLGGGRRLPFLWTLDWRFFFDQSTVNTPKEERNLLQKSRRIDTKLAGGLKSLPGIEDDFSTFLGERNLRRGRSMGLPSGQAVARRMSAQPLTQAQVRLSGEAPLWFYILREAEVTREGTDEYGGTRLGTIGGRIVAEVILGILKADPFCFLRTQPTWCPILPPEVSEDPSKWGMADLLRYAVPRDGRDLQPHRPGPEPSPEQPPDGPPWV